MGGKSGDSRIKFKVNNLLKWGKSLGNIQKLNIIKTLVFYYNY
jgi:hypothetical protein